MNTRMRNILLIVVASVIGLWVVTSISRSTFFTPRAEKLQRIDDLTERITARTGINPMVMRRQLQGFSDQTLGSDRETADHELRTHLNRLAEQLGLSGASVSTAGASAKLSPARNKFQRRGVQRELRELIDLVEIEGWINAEGTIQQAVALLDALATEPWLKRIDQVKLTAKDGGTRCGISVRLTTLILPGYRPASELDVQPYESQRLARFASIVDTNPFALPKPEPAAPVQVAENPEPAPKPKPEFPYSNWALTGTAAGPDGVEAWLHQQATGETLRLLVGDSIGKAVLLAAEGENARFELNQQQFLVSIGTTLNDRVPVQR